MSIEKECSVALYSPDALSVLSLTQEEPEQAQDQGGLGQQIPRHGGREWKSEMPPDSTSTKGHLTQTRPRIALAGYVREFGQITDLASWTPG